MTMYVLLQICISHQVRHISNDILPTAITDIIILILSYPNDKMTLRALVSDMNTATGSSLKLFNMEFHRSQQSGLPILCTRSWAPSGVSTVMIKHLFID